MSGYLTCHLGFHEKDHLNGTHSFILRVEQQESLIWTDTQTQCCEARHFDRDLTVANFFLGTIRDKSYQARKSIFSLGMRMEQRQIFENPMISFFLPVWNVVTQSSQPQSGPIQFSQDLRVIHYS